MNKLFILIFSFLLGLQTLTAQDITVRALQDFCSNVEMNKNTRTSGLDLSNIEGTPYLNETFVIGDILTTSETKYLAIPLRYNVYSDEFEFKGENEKIFSLENSIIKSLQLENTTFTYKAFAEKKHIGRSFFEVLVQGKISLLKQYHIRFESAQQAQAFKDPTPAKFETDSPEFYLSFGEEAAIRVSNTKDFLNCITSTKNEIEAFIKKNKLKVGKQEDTIKIVEYYNSL